MVRSRQRISAGLRRSDRRPGRPLLARCRRCPPEPRYSRHDERMSGLRMCLRSRPNLPSYFFRMCTRAARGRLGRRKGDAMATQTTERPIHRRTPRLGGALPWAVSECDELQARRRRASQPRCGSCPPAGSCLRLPTCTQRRSGACAATLMSWLRPARVDGKLRSEPVSARAEVLTATRGIGACARSFFWSATRLSYRLVMLMYRLGRRLRGQQSVADGAALAITIE